MSEHWCWRMWAVLLCLATLSVCALLPTMPPYLTDPSYWCLVAAYMFTFFSEIFAVRVTAHAEKEQIPSTVVAGLLFSAAVGLGLTCWRPSSYVMFLNTSILVPNYRVVALFLHDCRFLRKEISGMKKTLFSKEQNEDSYRTLFARVHQLQRTHKWWLLSTIVASVFFVLAVVLDYWHFAAKALRQLEAQDFQSPLAAFFVLLLPPLVELLVMAYTNKAIRAVERELFDQDQVTMLHLRILFKPARLSVLGVPITVNKAAGIVSSLIVTAAVQSIRFILW